MDHPFCTCGKLLAGQMTCLVCGKPRYIVNTWEQLCAAGGDAIAITRQSRGDSRSVRSPGWHVMRLVDGREVVTDADAHWSDYKRKFFTDFMKTRKESLAEAIAWVKKQYPKYKDVRWVGNRSGDQVPAEINKRFPIRRSP